MSRTLNSWVFYRHTGGSDRKYEIEGRSTYTGFFDTTVLAGIGPVCSSPLGSSPFIWVLTTWSSSSLRCWKKRFVLRLRAHDASPPKGTRAAGAGTLDVLLYLSLDITCNGQKQIYRQCYTGSAVQDLDRAVH
jgi:hypothetical protein